MRISQRTDGQFDVVDEHGTVLDGPFRTRGAAALARAEMVELDRLADEEDAEAGPEACPGCGCKPGDGPTAGCVHPLGCGFDPGVF